MVGNYGLDKNPTTRYNPQSNRAIERIYAVLNDIQRTFELEKGSLDKDRPWDEFLSATAFALRAMCSTIQHYKPRWRADWDVIKQGKEEEIDCNNHRESRSRISHK